MAKKSDKASKTKLELNKVSTLSKEQNESLAATPLKRAGAVFEALARWRDKSLTSGFKI